MKLEMKNINKSFGEHHVLKDINLSVESGRAMGLLGRNGAGKTTSIRILMDVFKADSGEILLDGVPIDHEKVTKGYLPEERGLYPKKKIIDQLVYLAQLKGMKKTDAVTQADRWLAKLGMSEHRDSKLETLSKGNQQKIQLITAVIHNPDIVILDEPFSGLDPVNAKLLENVVKSQIEKGKIVLFSSHQMSYIEEFCDDIAILYDGKIVLSGDVKEIKRGYKRDKLFIRTINPDQITSDFADRTEVLEDGTIILKLDSVDQKKEMMSKITDKYDIDEIGIFEPSMNDIFVEYAGREEEAKDEAV